MIVDEQKRVGTDYSWATAGNWGGRRLQTPSSYEDHHLDLLSDRLWLYQKSEGQAARRNVYYDKYFTDLRRIFFFLDIPDRQRLNRTKRVNGQSLKGRL